jgi:phosphate transport system substrate-binding protein
MCEITRTDSLLEREHMKFSKSVKVVAVAAASLMIAPAAFAGVTISGDGSSFAAPLLNACKAAWQSSTGNTLGSYPAGGSGTGRKNADNGIGDFNFSDASYVPAKSSIIHIPVVAAPVAIAYNLVGKPSINLSQKTLSDIFAGKVQYWDDSEIKADNTKPYTKIIFKTDGKGNPVKDASGKPVVLNKLSVTPHFTVSHHKITIVTRSDSSGTTQNLVNFFIAQFPSVWTKPSNGTFANVFPGDINAPENLGRIQSAKGSALVAAAVKATPYSIGYMEASYAKNNGLGVINIQNAAGNFQAPDAAGTAAFLSAATASADGKLTFNYNTTDAGAYVLGIVSYALVDTANSNANSAAVKSFLQYVLSPACPSTDGTLGYTTITGNLLATDTALLAKLK